MDSYAVYRVTAQPGHGYQRSYVGHIRVDRWGGSVEEAVEARVQHHMHRPAKKGSAVWLRPCTGATHLTLARAQHKSTALRLELYHTLTSMLEIGELLVRGACFVRVPVPWNELVPLLDLVKGSASFGLFTARLREADISDLVGRHLRGECFGCGSTKHIVEDCGLDDRAHVQLHSKRDYAPFPRFS